MLVLDIIVALEIIILIWQGWQFNQNEQEIIGLLKQILAQLPPKPMTTADDLKFELGQPFAQSRGAQ